jgi:hypothetical protein
MLKKFIRKILSNFGFKLIKTNVPEVRFENFINLAQAYEKKLNEISGTKFIKYDEIRPKLLGRLLGTPPSEAYFIIEALEKSKTINGDICEFGVAQGSTSALIANEIKKQDKKLHLFDSFEGLPRPSSKDQLKVDIFSLGNIKAYTGTMSCSETMVISRLKELSFPENRYIIHKGFIEELIQKDKKMPEKVSFAYVDFDFYEPIMIALNFLDKVTASGAIIIVDDYDYFSTGSKIAVDEFVKGKNVNRKIYNIEIPDSTYGHFAILTKKV